MKIKSEKEALQMFCGKEEGLYRELYKQPYANEADNMKIIATDGKAMLIVDKSLTKCKYKTISQAIPTFTGGAVNIEIEFSTIDKAYEKLEFEKEMVSKDGGTKECEDCEGTGHVDFEFESIDGELYYIEEDCPVCDGTGEREGYELVETGRQVPCDNQCYLIGGVYFREDIITRVVSALRLMGFERITWTLYNKNGANKFKVCEGIDLYLMPTYCEGGNYVEIIL